jgi:hypothetical protein
MGNSMGNSIDNSMDQESDQESDQEFDQESDQESDQETDAPLQETRVFDISKVPPPVEFVSRVINQLKAVHNGHIELDAESLEEIILDLKCAVLLLNGQMIGFADV